MSSSDKYYIELLTNFRVYLYRYVGIIAYVIAMIGNLLTLWIFVKKSWRKNVCVFYFTVCIFSNTLLISTFLPATIFIYGFNISIQNSNLFLCKLVSFLSYLFSIYFPIVLILASIDRLLISSQNVDTRLYSSKRLAYLLISINAFIWTVFSLHILIKFSIQKLSPTISVCSPDFSASYQNFISVFYLIFIPSVYIVMITLSILSFKNVRHIQPVPRQQRHQSRSMTKKDFQLLRCLYLHNTQYIIFSSIKLVSSIYSVVMQYQTQTSLQQAINTFLATVGNLVCTIGLCMCFFTFIGVSKAFRQEIKRIFCKFVGKNVRTIRDEERNQTQSKTENVQMNNVSVVDTIILTS